MPPLKNEIPHNLMITRDYRTRGRDRTGTSVTSLVFETNASTNSATRASGLKKGSQIYTNYLNTSNAFLF